MPSTPMDSPFPASADYRWAFDLAPIGLILSRQRIIVDCNQKVCELFAVEREDLLQQSFAILYPSQDEFQRTGERIAQPLMHHGSYRDERIMRRVGGRFAGELFWCRVSGRALDRSEPHAAGIWSFEDIDSRQPLTPDRATLTPREREVASQLLTGMTSKEIARALGLSHRTVEVHRASLMRKYGTGTTAALVQKLMAGSP